MDTAFKSLAAEYVEREGERLRAENESYAASLPFAVSKGFEAKVYAKIRRHKQQRAYYALSAIAACILIAFIGVSAITGMISRTGGDIANQHVAIGEQQATDGATLATSGDLLVADGAAQATMDSEWQATGGSDSQAVDGEQQAADVAQPAAGGEYSDVDGFGEPDGYEVITLSYSLPAHLSVADVMQDRGQTVFYIDNAYNDNIVLIAEKDARNGGTAQFDEARLREGGLRRISINDQEIYAVARADYSYITFQSEGVIYSASCKHDYRTLMSLCEYIL